MDRTPWFTTAIIAGQASAAIVSVVIAPNAPAGSYGFTCTLTVASAPPSAASAVFTVGAGTPSACVPAPPTTNGILGPALMTLPYTYAGMGLAPPIVAQTNPGPVWSYDVAVNPGVATDPSQAWVGFGFSFQSPPCLDASMFTGIQFTITGTLGTCELHVSVVPSEDSLTPRNPFGSCTMEPCYPPVSGPLSTGTSTVSFAEMTGGMPVATVDPRELTGIQWTLNLPTVAGTAPCAASFTLSDVSFVAGR